MGRDQLAQSRTEPIRIFAEQSWKRAKAQPGNSIICKCSETQTLHLAETMVLATSRLSCCIKRNFRSQLVGLVQRKLLPEIHDKINPFTPFLPIWTSCFTLMRKPFHRGIFNGRCGLLNATRTFSEKRYNGFLRCTPQTMTRCIARA